MTKMADIKAEFSKYIVIKDERILEMILASVVGNMLLDRDPLWIFIVAPSSGGKSTVIAPLVGLPSVHFIDDLTEKTFLSGFKIKGKEMSLLKIIGSGILAFSDFTTILGKNPMSKGEILSQLRVVYDGVMVKQTGTGKISWSGKMGVSACCTPDIYTLLESVRSAGERFIFYWMEQPTDDEIVDKQQGVSKSSKEITEIMKALYADYYNGISDWVKVHGIPELSMSQEQRIKARKAAKFCVEGKTTVRVDFKSGKPDAIPNKAGVGRDAKMFDTVLHTLQLMNCYENDDASLPVADWMIEVIEKCSYSALNRERRKILEILAHADGKPLSASEIGAKEGLGLEKESVEKYLMPLHSVGMIRKQTDGSRFKWYMDNQDTIDFILEVSSEVKDVTSVPALELEPEIQEGDLLAEFEEQNRRNAEEQAEAEAAALAVDD